MSTCGESAQSFRRGSKLIDRWRNNMAYSRWGSSRWYTFWAHQDQDTENRDNAIFNICPVARLAAWEIREDIEDCLTRVADLEEPTIPGDVSNAEREELRGYMLEFLADVDASYS